MILQKNMFKSIISRIPSLGNAITTSRLSSLCQPILSQKTPYKQPILGTYFPGQNESTSLLTKCLPVCKNLEFVRTNVRCHYRPSAIKRIRKHGLEKRLSSRSQREVLCRRFVKGRWTLSTFDRITNHFPEPKPKRVQLMDRKHGYRSKAKKPEYFQFLT